MRPASWRRNPKLLARCRIKEKLLGFTVTQTLKSTGGLLAALTCELMGLITDHILLLRMILILADSMVAAILMHFTWSCPSGKEQLSHVNISVSTLNIEGSTEWIWHLPWSQNWRSNNVKLYLSEPILPAWK